MSFNFDSFYQNINQIVNSIVVKIDRDAKKYETLETRKASDRYVSAINKEDDYDSYVRFDVEAIVAAGVSNIEEAYKCANDKRLIPYELRNIVVDKQRDLIIRRYIETNDYYRELIGLPKMEDYQDIYVDQLYFDKYSIPYSNKPIHLLDDNTLLQLDIVGVLDIYRNKYPEKKYLRFMGLNKVNLANARSAKNFAIVKIDKTIDSKFLNDFLFIYDECRTYFMSVIYNTSFSTRYDYYDNFIGFMILVMTIQRLIVNVFKMGIEKDFYDMDLIRTMFENYKVPFIDKLPIEYLRTIMKNLNYLLRIKSTDRVLYDLCSLLGFERMKIFKYYLIKEHRLDIDENPVFFYKDIVDDNGNTVTVQDKDLMYRYFFQGIDIKERNIMKGLSEIVNRKGYDEMILDDPFWFEDSDLKKQLMDEEFNYIQTKYMGVQLMYKMTEMLFEIEYALRMLTDRKNELSHVSIDLPKITGDKPVKIFDVVIALCAMICKKNNMKGNILYDPSKIMTVYGFNFKEDLVLLKKVIEDNKHLIDQDILTYINNLQNTSPENVNFIYRNIKNLHEFIIDKMHYSENIKEYHAYKVLFKTLMTTKNNGTLFTKSDGKIADTYLDYLTDQNPNLAYFIVNCDKDKVSEYIDHIIWKLNQTMNDLKYTHLINDSNNMIVGALLKLMKFFKSHTVDIHSMNIVYLFDSRYYNMVKLIGDVKSIQANMKMNTNIVDNYNDIVKLTTATLSRQDTLDILNKYILELCIHQDDDLKNDDKLQEIHNNISIDQPNLLTKIHQEVLNLILINNILKNEDSIDVYNKIEHKVREDAIDKLKEIHINIDTDFYIEHTDFFFSVFKILEESEQNIIKSDHFSALNIDIQNKIKNIIRKVNEKFNILMSVRTNVNRFYTDANHVDKNIFGIIKLLSNDALSISESNIQTSSDIYSSDQIKNYTASVVTLLELITKHDNMIHSKFIGKSKNFNHDSIGVKSSDYWLNTKNMNLNKVSSINKWSLFNMALLRKGADNIIIKKDIFHKDNVMVEDKIKLIREV